MGERSSIEWTHATFNPWIGCTHVSPGCVNCYAETLMADRYGRVVWGERGARSRTSVGYWRGPLKWDAEARAEGVRRRVFCASLADVFDPHPSILPEWRSDLWALIDATPALDWLLLTKRPENVREMVPPSWLDGLPGNVWMGTSVEDQRRADERIPQLLRIPARVRFLSMEPLLERVSLNGYVSLNGKCVNRAGYTDALDWVIVGGESGPNHRPMQPEWVREIRDRCFATRTAFLFKQWGGATPKANGRELDGRTWDQFPQSLHAASLTIRGEVEKAIREASR